MEIAKAFSQVKVYKSDMYLKVTAAILLDSSFTVEAMVTTTESLSA